MCAPGVTSLFFIERSVAKGQTIMRKMTSWFLICLCALQGCAGLAVVDSNASVHRPVLTDASALIRTLGTDHQYSQLPAASVAERLRALHPEETLSILALSSGANSAFGAGAVAGLTLSGSRPDFTVVTGVSGGALVAPYAFLGSAWDARLLDAFTNAAGENLLQSRGLGVIFGSSVYRGAPLRRLVDAHVTDAMIQAVAREAEKGRLLLVATTDVATGEPVVWDMGAIARNGGADARALFRDVLVASASVPGMFPPVIIRVHEQGVPHNEAHIDGAATMPFFVPTAFLQRPLDTLGNADHTAVYLIIDGPLAERARTTRLTARAILSRSVGTELNHMMLTTLELTAANAQLHGATLLYSAIPSAYPRVDAFDFRTDTRQALFHYAYGCAQAGRLWTQFRPFEEDSESLLGNADARKVPCPANDVSNIGYFVSR
jgi:predicted acylesterase/phospholipase RssA